jgi:Zn-dependent protease with chaperone function
MMQFEAKYYNGRDAGSETVTVSLVGDKLSVRRGDEVLEEYPFAAVKIKDRIGDLPRHMTFPSGGSCETSDNDAVDALMEFMGTGKTARMVHKLEMKKRYVIFASVFTVAFVLGMFFYGVPMLAKGVAFALPVETNIRLGASTLSALDKHLFSESTLSEEVKRRLMGRFNKLLDDMSKGFGYRMVFRSGGRIGANAMALPNGTVIFTDELINLAENDEEIVSVMAHELGHVAQRHGIRTLLQHSFMSAVAIAVTGDVSSLTVGIPTFLVESKYSREFEREADNFAIKMLIKHDIPVKHFADMLDHLTEGRGKDGKVFTYLSSHPAPAERIKMIREAEVE